MEKLEWKTAAERINACQKSLAAYIEPCEHEFTYQDFDGVDHYAGACKYCFARKDGKVKLNHVFDEKNHADASAPGFHLLRIGQKNP